MIPWTIPGTLIMSITHNTPIKPVSYAILAGTFALGTLLNLLYINHADING
ncbi:hypothetical protein [Candidatus Aquicultor sp.]